MSENKNAKEKLSEINESILDCVARAIDEISLDYQKQELIDTGIVDTGKLRHIIQSVKDLKDFSKLEENLKEEELSKLYEALESEDED